MEGGIRRKLEALVIPEVAAYVRVPRGSEVTAGRARSFQHAQVKQDDLGFGEAEFY